MWSYIIIYGRLKTNKFIIDSVSYSLDILKRIYFLEVTKRILEWTIWILILKKKKINLHKPLIYWF